MRLTPSTFKQIVADHPQITFVESDEFRWSPQDMAIHYTTNDPHALEHIIHELAHYDLGHSNYSRDIGLLGMERDAWMRAKTLAPRYNCTFDEQLVQDDLDTYREWLHSRSTCPQCNATGIQTGPKEYGCSACGRTWHVNQALSCALRRYTLSPKQKHLL